MRVIVIGGGPAGMYCAGVAASNGDDITLIEKNEKLGKKLYITGKGRCNVTNNSPQDLFISNVVNNSKFVISSLYRFGPDDAMEFYENQGVPLKIERGGRVFPQSDKSSDIIEAHIKHLKENNVNILYNSSVQSLLLEDSTVKGVKLLCGDKLYADRIVVATGGKSYPMTGSTGDGYIFAKQCGHSVIDPKPSLVSMLLANETKDLEGLTLKNVQANILNSNRKILFSEFGEMLFTSKGVSGPIILSLSSYINRLEEKLTLSIDLKPALSLQQLDDRLLRDFSNNNNKDFINSLSDLLPRSLIPEIILRSDIDPRSKVHQIDRDSRLRLVSILKSLDFDLVGLDSIDNAIITSGGVNIKEINPRTMESKLINGLYFVGEILDVDALTGGYSIQIALSTAFVAGSSL